MKHLFNDIPKDEKKRILEMHKNQRDSEMINENPRRYAAQFVKGAGDVIRTRVRQVGRYLNPPKKIEARRGFEEDYYGLYRLQSIRPHNEKVLNLLGKVGIVKNNQVVQNELRDFSYELKNIKNIIQNNETFSSSNKFTYTKWNDFFKETQLVRSLDDARYLNNILKRLLEKYNTPIGKDLHLGGIYKDLDDIYRYVLENPQFKPILEPKLKKAFEVLDKAISKIESQAAY